MKMVKKILLGLAAGAVVIGLVSCADVAGAGKATVTKTNKTITVDATDKASKKLEKDYRRYIKQLGSSEKVAEIQEAQEAAAAKKCGSKSAIMVQFLAAASLLVVFLRKKH